MKLLLLNLFILLTINSGAQKKEELFNYQFKPSKSSSYYYVVTEKEENGWHRKAYYISQKSIAMEGWYKDEACRIPHGEMTWYHPTRSIKSKGNNVDGKKEGIWLEWNEKGLLIDSSSFEQGMRAGISMRWHNNGTLKDSLDFDGQGNGVQVSWHDDGSLAAAGRWIQDTSKRGRWKYYHKTGQTMATEDFAYGKKLACACYNEQGVQLDSLACIERDAIPPGGKIGWRNFLERGMGNILSEKVRTREWSEGNATVWVRFVVDTDGKLTDFTPLTNNGRQMEQEVIRMLEHSPQWTPAQQYGQRVKSYYIQPVTLQIQSR